ncbi:MAG: hypothetical protein JWQ69_5499 [Pseudomonas sp.]|nr:hypothetical protein [Pseudomonas sp.]
MKDPFDASNYSVLELNRSNLDVMKQYEKILRQSYEAIGFFKQSILPGPDTQCFGLFFDGNMEGTLGLSEAQYSEEKPYLRYLPEIGHRPKLLEATNVVLTPTLRGSIAIGVLLREAATRAIEGGFDFVVGITRYQTLRYFVEFGLVPIDHPPLHLMGRADVDDWIMYYRTSEASAALYLKERSDRYFHQQKTMSAIRQRRKQIEPLQDTVRNGSMVHASV